jgi:hypothetical protein
MTFNGAKSGAPERFGRRGTNEGVALLLIVCGVRFAARINNQSVQFTSAENGSSSSIAVSTHE